MNYSDGRSNSPEEKRTNDQIWYNTNRPVRGKGRGRGRVVW